MSLTDPTAKCSACGHTTADHPEGYMGAQVGDTYLCHQDDHDCYLPGVLEPIATNGEPPLPFVRLPSGGWQTR